MIPVGPKKRGRPATGRDPSVSFRIKLNVLRDVEAWADERRLSRTAALLALIKVGMSERIDADRIAELEASLAECDQKRRAECASNRTLRAKLAAMRQVGLDAAHIEADSRIESERRL